MVKEYWQHSEPTLEQQLQYQQTFGIFIGRLTMSRAAILYKLMSADKSSVSEQIFASLMQQSSPVPWKLSTETRRNLENISGWLPLHTQADMFDWFDNNPIASVDFKSVRDQFSNHRGWVDTNISLLQHYNRFAVEIVCETYTVGNTFFPSEKTIRPLMAAKPIIVYGPRYYLARLRQAGFRTYNEIWDESYDLAEDGVRIERIAELLKSLDVLSTDAKQRLFDQAQEVIEHNWNHFYNSGFEAVLWTELNEMLAQIDP
jgi:hypothetical protein